MKVVKQGKWEVEKTCWRCKTVVALEEPDLYADTSTFVPYQIYWNCPVCGQPNHINLLGASLVADRARSRAVPPEA